MSTTEPHDDPAVGGARRTALNEDWAATIVGHGGDRVPGVRDRAGPGGRADHRGLRVHLVARRPAGPGRHAARFPKFVLGLLAASIIATIFTSAVGSADAKPYITIVNDLRTLFLILAFVSIGLKFRVAPLREAGWRPVGVFASATVVNLAVGLGLAVLLLSGFSAAEEHR
jgi:hypothetical protein